jgi:hypothetical protein
MKNQLVSTGGHCGGYDHTYYIFVLTLLARFL